MIEYIIQTLLVHFSISLIDMYTCDFIPQIFGAIVEELFLFNIVFILFLAFVWFVFVCSIIEEKCVRCVLRSQWGNFERFNPDWTYS